MMRRGVMVRCLLLLTTIALVVQSMLPTQPVTAQAPACVPRKCIYLPSVVRPLYLPITHLSTLTGDRGGLSYRVYVENTSPVALTNIVLLVKLSDPTNPITPTYVYTSPLIAQSIYVLGPDEFTQFQFNSQKINDQVPILDISAISWTVALPTENVPLSLTPIYTAPFVDINGHPFTNITFIIKNTSPQVMREAEGAFWFTDYTGQSTCIFLNCQGRIILHTFQPGEQLTLIPLHI
jgi:hypothetical protein